MELAYGQMDLDLALIKLIAARFTDHYRPILPIANNLLTVRAIVTESPKLNRLKCANYHFKY